MWLMPFACFPCFIFSVVKQVSRQSWIDVVLVVLNISFLVATTVLLDLHIPVLGGLVNLFCLLGFN